TVPPPGSGAICAHTRRASARLDDLGACVNSHRCLAPRAAVSRPASGRGRRLVSFSTPPSGSARTANSHPAFLALLDLLGARVSGHLRLGSREGPLAHGPPAPTDHDSRGDRADRSLGEAPGARRTAGDRDDARAPRDQLVRDVPRLLPLRRLRPGVPAQAWRIPGLRADDRGSRARDKACRPEARESGRRPIDCHGDRRGYIAADLVPARLADELGALARDRLDPDDRRGLEPRRRTGQTTCGAVHRDASADPRLVVPGRLLAAVPAQSPPLVALSRALDSRILLARCANPDRLPGRRALRAPRPRYERFPADAARDHGAGHFRPRLPLRREIDPSLAHAGCCRGWSR